MPTLFEQYSDTNIQNSIATVLATKLLAAGYLVYWQSRDAVQTLDGVYFQWSTNYATYMANGAFAARVTAAKALVSLVESIPTAPQWLVRPITVAGPLTQDQRMLPVLSLEVGPAIALRSYQLGSPLKWRNRHLILDGYVRSRTEQKAMADLFSQWFDNETMYSVLDHDAGTLAVVGDVECIDTRVDWRLDPLAVDPATYQVLCNARLQYIA